MDWSRAKTILIIVFGVLNLMLGYQIWIAGGDRAITDPGTVENDQYIEQLLQEKNIAISGQIPPRIPKMSELTVRFERVFFRDKENENELQPDMLSEIVDLETPIEFNYNNLNDVKSRLDTQLGGFEHYEFDKVVEGRSYQVLLQYHEGLPMFEAQLWLLIENGWVARYSKTEVTVLPSEDKEAHSVLTGKSAIAILAENYLQNGTVVEDIRLGYHGRIYDSETQVLAPFWRIITNDGQLYYVHALTGAVEVQSISM